MIRFTTTTTLLLTTLLGAAAPDLAGAQGASLIGGNVSGLLLCRASVNTAEAKLAKSLLRCDRLERKRTLAEFDANTCRKKALRHRVAAAPISCVKTPPRTTDRYTCSGLSCQCTGDVDCNDMFTNAGCSDVASCDTTGNEPVCSCLLALF